MHRQLPGGLCSNKSERLVAWSSRFVMLMWVFFRQVFNVSGSDHGSAGKRTCQGTVAHPAELFMDDHCFDAGCLSLS